MRKALLLASLLLPGIGLADPDGEREALARLVHEIEALNPLLEQAETQADATQRVRFQYGWLRRDLTQVKLGILEHIDSPRAEPREIAPLKGDYRR